MEHSNQLKITEQHEASKKWNSNTIFEPQMDPKAPIFDENGDNSSNASSSSEEKLTVPAPANKLTLFSIILAPEKKLSVLAIRVSTLEKAATSLGVLGFIWATVVLLGGFAVTLKESDFWYITTILVIEGTRIFSRSHELEWQHMANWSLEDAGINSFSTLKLCSYSFIKMVKTFFFGSSSSTDSQVCQYDAELAEVGKKNEQNMESFTSNVPFYRVFLAKNTSRILYWLQVSSALVCVTLSLIKLIKQNFGEISEENSSIKKNRSSALNLFYVLAFSEAMLLLMGKAYWEWKVTYCKLMEEVNEECELGPSGMVPVKKFYYDTYSSCINGSIFDGLKLDMASFGIELLTSYSFDEQLVGARILRKFSTNERFSNDTLRKIGVSEAAIERLVEMLNWKDPQEEEIRLSAAEILSKLAGKKQSSLRIARIPGSIESISSLLHVELSSRVSGEEISENYVADDIEYSTFNHLGLLILKKLAHNHDNCGKIGNTRGLLPKIVEFTNPGDRFRTNGMKESHILAVKRSLKLLKILISTTGATGKLLRWRISKIVFTVSNIREILCHGENYQALQILGMQILIGLSLEEDAKERIGSTGGILKELFYTFLYQGRLEIWNNVRVVAGETIAMLVFESEGNCRRVLKLNLVRKLVEALEDEDRFVCKVSARVLRNLCIYTRPDCFIQLLGVAAAAPTVLRAIMSEENKMQEVMLGLAAQVFSFMDPEESSIIFKEIGLEESELAMTLVQILKHNQFPSVKVPRIRRFAIELAICMMKNKEENLHIFRNLGMVQELDNVIETTSELERFDTFSGSIGLSRHNRTIHSLIDTALELLAKG